MPPGGVADRLSVPASTRPGSRAPAGNAWSAPSATARSRLASLRLVALIRSHGRPAEQDERGGHAAARALDQDRGARLEAGPAEQHPVRGEVGGRQARGLLERQRGGLGHQVAPGHRDPLRERAVVALGQQGPARVQRLVAAFSPGWRSPRGPRPRYRRSPRPRRRRSSTIGSRSAEMSTPRSVHTSWWLSEGRLDRDRGPTVLGTGRARRARLHTRRPAARRRRCAPR